MNGDLDMVTNRVKNVAEPIVDRTTTLQDAATKNFLISVIDALHPVGSLHFGPNPNGGVFPGVWVALAANTFLMASGSGGGAGATGGQNTKTLSTANMPQHNHSLSMGGAGGHSHTINHNGTGGPTKWSNGPDIHHGGIRMIGGYNNGNTAYTSSLGNHSHSMSMGLAGSTSSFDMRPQYESVEVWKRTS